MASKTQKTEIIRHRKHASNKVNNKTEQKRMQESLQVIAKLESENRKQA